MITAIFWIVVGLLYTNLLEWIFHQYPLHSMHHFNKNQKSILWFHMIHHKKVTKESYTDYHEIDRYLIADIASLVFLAIAHYLLFVSWLGLFWLFIGGLLGDILFMVVHIGSHAFPELGKKYVPWHYDHHMHYPNSNWCVTLPIFDILFGTYRRYPQKNKEQPESLLDQ